MANWPRPVSDEVIDRQREYLNHLESRHGGKVVATYRALLTPGAKVTPGRIRRHGAKASVTAEPQAKPAG